MTTFCVTAKRPAFERGWFLAPFRGRRPRDVRLEVGDGLWVIDDGARRLGYLAPHAQLCAWREVGLGVVKGTALVVGERGATLRIGLPDLRRPGMDDAASVDSVDVVVAPQDFDALVAASPCAERAASSVLLPRWPLAENPNGALGFAVWTRSLPGRRALVLQGEELRLVDGDRALASARRDAVVITRGSWREPWWLRGRGSTFNGSFPRGMAVLSLRFPNGTDVSLGVRDPRFAWRDRPPPARTPRYLAGPPDWRALTAALGVVVPGGRR